MSVLMQRSFTVVVLALCLSACSVLQNAEPMPSWNEGASKSAITTFVARVTDKASPDYVPPEERIVTFDNDGTLWAEQPMYFQLFFVLDRLKVLAPAHPEWQDTEPFASALKGDLSAAEKGGMAELAKLVMAAQAGVTTEEFSAAVSDWIATARHPDTGKRYTEMVYQPMLELIDHLRANDFDVWIVSGGGIDFMRAWAEEVYGVPPDHVIGSRIKTRFEMREDGPVLMRDPGFEFINDGEGKPVAINLQIGRRPIAAFGNSDGDLPMLQWTTAGDGLRFAAYVHHTDAQREWAYDRTSAVGKLDKGLDAAAAQGWTLIDMQRDWKRIYPGDSVAAD